MRGCASLAGAGAPARWELATIRWVNDLPSWLYVPLWPLMQYGALGAIPVTAGVALLFRRRRLGFSIAAAGSVGYVSAKIIKGIVERGRPADFLTDVKVREHFGAQSLGYPSGHAVVAATITTICVAYLPRRWSRAAVLLTATVAFARIYSGGHLALDVIGGAGLGVMLGLLAGLVGTDGPTPELQTMHTDEVAEGDAHDADPVARLVAPNIRHPGDVVRVSAGIVVLVITVLAVYRDRLSTFETNLFRLINDLPSAIAPYLNVVMQAGNALAGPVLALLVLAIGSRRRWRQAFDLAVAGTLAWVAAKVVKDIIQRPRPGGLLEDVARFGSDGGLGFVSGHTAVAPPWRRLPRRTLRATPVARSGSYRGSSGLRAFTLARICPSTSSVAQRLAGSSAQASTSCSALRTAAQRSTRRPRCCATPAGRPRTSNGSLERRRVRSRSSQPLTAVPSS